MYTIFIPKYKGEKTDYLITKAIELYMKNSSCNCIISSPGYMSKNSKTISMFVDKLGKIMTAKRIPNKNPYIGFFNGMNGSSQLSDNPPLVNKPTIREEHEYIVNSLSTLNLLPIRCKDVKDHRKMMFFIDCNCITKNKSCRLDKNKYKCFLDHCTVYGVLIGSSNQSLGTYFGGRKSARAGQGEADVLMYTDDNNSKITEDLIELQSNNRNIRISESIDENNYRTVEDDNMFFKEILKNFLENNLI